MTVSIQGTYPALLTPRKRDGAVDLNALERCAEFVMTLGASGVVTCGGSGEYFDLSIAQCKEILVKLVPVAKGRGQLIAGIGAATLEESVQLGHHALNAGADAVLLPPPYFFRYEGTDLLHFFRQAAREINGPVLLYNLAAFVSPIPDEVALELLESEPNIIGIKDSSGSRNVLSKLTSKESSTYVRILGDDSLAVECIRRGEIDALISGPAGVIPEASTALFNLVSNPEAFELAAGLYTEFIAQIRHLPYPWALKWLAEKRGLGTARLPFNPSQERQQSRQLLEAWFEQWFARLEQYCKSGWSQQPSHSSSTTSDS